MTKRKITFLLQQDQDGYPPVVAERVWADHVSSDLYRLDNIPFFATKATLGDIVRVESVDGELRFSDVVVPSRNSLIRVLCYDGADVDTIREKVSTMGCATEYDATHGLIAISVPPEVDIAQVYAAFENEFRAGLVDYEEALLR